MIYLFIFSFIGIIIGSVLGGVFSLFNNKLNKNLLSFLQAFSIGIILALIFFELFHESFEGFYDLFPNNNLYPILLGSSIILATFLFFFILHLVLDKFVFNKKEHEDHEDEVCDDHIHSHSFNSESNPLSSIVFLVAIFIHNVPEGLSLGSFFIGDTFPISGLIISLSMFIHNLIIGYSMGTSFSFSNKSKKFIILMCIISALPSFVFSIVGYFLSTSFDVTITSIIFSISTGSLLFVLIKELLPQLFVKYHSKFNSIYLVIGLILGIILINI